MDGLSHGPVGRRTGPRRTATPLPAGPGHVVSGGAQRPAEMRGLQGSRCRGAAARCPTCRHQVVGDGLVVEVGGGSGVVEYGGEAGPPTAPATDETVRRGGGRRTALVIVAAAAVVVGGLALVGPSSRRRGSVGGGGVRTGRRGRRRHDHHSAPDDPADPHDPAGCLGRAAAGTGVRHAGRRPSGARRPVPCLPGVLDPEHASKAIHLPHVLPADPYAPASARGDGVVMIDQNAGAASYYPLDERRGHPSRVGPAGLPVGRSRPRGGWSTGAPTAVRR